MVNKFELYTNKSSLDRPFSRYLIGGITDKFSDRLGWWDAIEIPHNAYDDVTYVIEKHNENRPDLVSYKFYGRPDLAWLILQYNYIIDINEEFSSGKTLLLPSSSRVFNSILATTQKPNVIQSS